MRGRATWLALDLSLRDPPLSAAGAAGAYNHSEKEPLKEQER